MDIKSNISGNISCNRQHYIFFFFFERSHFKLDFDQILYKDGCLKICGNSDHYTTTYKNTKK